MEVDPRPLRHELERRADRYARAERWEPVPVDLDRAIAADAPLAEAARALRLAQIPVVGRRLASVPMPADLGGRYSDVWISVPRERFVLPEDIAISAEDEPVPVDRFGRATVSAPHAYFLTFALLGLREGDHFLELGTGTGYGAALARAIVGPRGRVTTLEIDPVLEERAARLLSGVSPDLAPVTVLLADASTAVSDFFTAGSKPNKIAYTYALASDPLDVIAAMPLGAVLVAPVGREDDQMLVRFEKSREGVERTVHGAVRYVTERH